MDTTGTKNLTDVLNKQVANWIVLFIKLHHFHWYVKGENFFVLHEKFEELYNEGAQYIDELAERLLALGGNPVSSLKEALASSSVAEAEQVNDSRMMVQAVVDDFSILITELKQGIEMASDANDDTTEDLLLSIQKTLEKQKWLLEAFLG